MDKTYHLCSYELGIEDFQFKMYFCILEVVSLNEGGKFLKELWCYMVWG